MGWYLLYADNHYSLSLQLVRADSSKATFEYKAFSSQAGSGQHNVSAGSIDYAYTGEIPKTENRQGPAKALRDWR